MKTSATNRRVHQLMSAIAERRLNPRPDFQRRMVWTNDDKLNFVNTVIKGYPFPEIYVCAGNLDPDTGVSEEYLVDGQQRITTLYQYFKGLPELRLAKGIAAYSSLTREQKENFLEYEVVVRDLGKLEIEQVKYIFEIINSANYALNSIEIQNSRFSGQFKKFCEDFISRNEFSEWKIFKLNDIRRMQDLRFSLALVATVMSTYFNRDEEIRNFLETFNDEFLQAEKLSIELTEVLGLITKLNLPEKSRVFRKTDIFTLIIEIHRTIYKRNEVLDLQGVRSRILSFFDEVEQIANGRTDYKNDDLAYIYYKSTIRAAIDRGNRVRRGEIIQSILDVNYSAQLKFATSQIEIDIPSDNIEEGEF